MRRKGRKVPELDHLHGRAVVVGWDSRIAMAFAWSGVSDCFLLTTCMDTTRELFNENEGFGFGYG